MPGAADHHRARRGRRVYRVQPVQSLPVRHGRHRLGPPPVGTFEVVCFIAIVLASTFVGVYLWWAGFLAASAGR